MPRILIADKLTDEGRTILAAGGKNEVDYRPEITAAELLADIHQYEAVVVRSRAQITGPMIEAAPNLRVVGRAGVGLDNVDLETATRCGVIVMNAPEGNTISTAEHTVAMMMSLARSIPAADASMKSGRWEKSAFKGTELRGKTVGVVGLGRIGREVAARLQAFKMNVLGFDPFVTSEAMTRLGIKEASVDQICREADFITVHVPLTEHTSNMINAARIATMKKSARIVNCARGGIIDEVALAQALTEGRIAGAAFDVFEVEPAPADHPLRKAPNTVLTPHLAASTDEAQKMVVKELAEQIIQVLECGVVRNAANYPRIPAEAMERYRPWLSLSEHLGCFLSQFVEGTVTRIRTTTEGRVNELGDVSPLTTATVYGFLKNASSNKLNYVNARHELQLKGVEVVEGSRTGETGEFTALLEIEATVADGRTFVVAGTLHIPSNQPRLVRVNGIALDAVPQGNLVVLENQDVPGVIGQVATALGAAGINIAQVTWGRTQRGGIALTVINVDDPVDADTLQRLRSISSLNYVKNVVVK